VNIRVLGSPSFVKIFKALTDEFIIQQINEAMNFLKEDDNKGNYIDKKPYPKRYLKHEITNLYRYPISSYRLIYTIKGNKEEKIYLLLDFLTHKHYDEIFGYNTS